MEIECNLLTLHKNRQNGKQLDVGELDPHMGSGCVCPLALCVQSANSSYLSWPHAYRENYYLCRVCANYCYLLLYLYMEYDEIPTIIIIIILYTHKHLRHNFCEPLIKLQYKYEYAPASTV